MVSIFPSTVVHDSKNANIKMDIIFIFYTKILAMNVDEIRDHENRYFCAKINFVFCNLS